MVDKSGVVRVKIEGDNEPQPTPREEVRFRATKREFLLTILICLSFIVLRLPWSIFENFQLNISFNQSQGQVPFVFVGTVESITNAKILLEYHLAHLKVLFASLLLFIIYVFFYVVLVSNLA